MCVYTCVYVCGWCAAVLYAREIEDDNVMTGDKEDNFEEFVSRQVSLYIVSTEACMNAIAVLICTSRLALKDECICILYIYIYICIRS